MATSITQVRGLRDGQDTANTGYLVRKIKALGAEVTVARTGRVTVRDRHGVRRVYVLVVDEHADDSPLTRALADLEASVA